MRALRVVMLLVIPSIAFAQTPLHFPFDINVSFKGHYLVTTQSMRRNFVPPPPDTVMTSILFSFPLKPGTPGVQFVYGGDSLIAIDTSVSYLPMRVHMYFDAARSLITRLDLYNEHQYTDQEWESDCSCEIPYFHRSAFQITLTNIPYCLDSLLFPDTLTSANVNGLDYGWFYSYDPDQQFHSAATLVGTDQFSYDSVRLGGWTEINSSVSAERRDIHPSLFVASHNLYFSSADRSRVLEVCNPLGLTFTYEIPAGQSAQAIPHLPTGIYFIRLGDQVRKVWVAE